MMCNFLVCAVLYKQSTKSFLYKNLPFLNLFPHIFIHNNSPQYNDVSKFSSNIIYSESNKNIGIAHPYNLAFCNARLLNCDYLLLLDQDTLLNARFCRELESAEPTKHDILLPKIFENNSRSFISPMQWRFIRPVPISKTADSDNVLFINSGSSLSVNFIKSIGGFNEIFWLDYLDHWLSYRAYQCKAKIRNLDAILEHNLSVNLKNYIPISRYRNIHYYEALFYLKYSNKLMKVSYLIKIIFRYFKRYKYFKSHSFTPEYFRLILRALK